MTKKSIVIYGAVNSGYDIVFPPGVKTKNACYILYTDESKAKGWEVRGYKNPNSLDGPRLNRWYKIFPHIALNEFEYSVYVDGNIRCIGDLTVLIEQFIDSGAALGLFKHRERENVLEELDACFSLGKISNDEYLEGEKQIKTYLNAGMPENQVLFDNGVIFRWHAHPDLSDAMQLWWDQFITHVKRDQLSMPYVIWKKQLVLKSWNWSFRIENKYFHVYEHRKSLMSSLKIRLVVLRQENIILNFLFLVVRSIHRRISKLVK